MKPEEQRIAIAEACPKIFRVMKLSGDIAWNKDGYEHDCDPLNDLNAMHEAEKVLELHQCREFESLLQNITKTSIYHKPYSERFSFHTTAAQRAEAFLKTIGKWKDAAQS